eukprot:PhF_6_TR41946/c0_g1_i2/m.63476
MTTEVVTTNMNNFLTSAKQQLGLAPPEEKGLFDDLGDSMSLSPTQRLSGFVMLITMGLVCLGVAGALIPTLALFPKKFAFFVTMGNFFLLASASILIGVRRQVKSMAEGHRIHCAVCFVMSLILTLVAAVHWQSYILSIVFTGLQLGSFTWYVLSYIPFARQFVSTCWGLLVKVLGPIVSVVASGCMNGCWALNKCLFRRATGTS